MSSTETLKAARLGGWLKASRRVVPRDTSPASTTPYRSGKLPRRRFVLPRDVDAAIFAVAVTFWWLPLALVARALGFGR